MIIKSTTTGLANHLISLKADYHTHDLTHAKKGCYTSYGRDDKIITAATYI